MKPPTFVHSEWHQVAQEERWYGGSAGVTLQV
jgi:hypothetical protein